MSLAAGPQTVNEEAGVCDILRFPWGDEADATFGVRQGFSPDAVVDEVLGTDGPSRAVLTVRRALLGSALAADMAGRWMSVSRNKNWYPGHFLRLRACTYKNVVHHGVEWMLGQNLLEGETAPRQGPHYQGPRWQSRYRLTDYGRAICASSQSFPLASRDNALVGSRVSLVDRLTREELEVPDTHKARSLNRFLAELSEATRNVELEGHGFSGIIRLVAGHDPGRAVVVNTGNVEWRAPYLWQEGQRKDRLESGGRPVGHWAQTVPKWARGRIRISGRQTVQADITASHLAILYADAGVPIPADPYEALQDRAGISRDLAKLVILIAVNAKNAGQGQASITSHVSALRQGLPCVSEAECRAALRSALPEDYGEARRLMNLAREVYRDIAAYFFSDVGVWCQAKEAEILRHAASALMANGFAPILLHDAILVADGGDAAAEAELVAAFKRVMGVECRVKLKAAVA